MTDGEQQLRSADAALPLPLFNRADVEWDGLPRADADEGWGIDRWRQAYQIHAAVVAPRAGLMALRNFYKAQERGDDPEYPHGDAVRVVESERFVADRHATSAPEVPAPKARAPLSKPRRLGKRALRAVQKGQTAADFLPVTTHELPPASEA